MSRNDLKLTEKINEFVQAGGVTQRELAARFRVSLNFIVTLLRLVREDRTFAPRPRGAVMKPLLTPEIMAFLAAEIAARCDSTLCELVALVEREYRI